MKRLIDKLSRFRSYLDKVIAASALAQAGEVELAREMMTKADRTENCCGAVSKGTGCTSSRETLCTLALQQQV
jgi:hypothetical protein